MPRKLFLAVCLVVFILASTVPLGQAVSPSSSLIASVGSDGIHVSLNLSLFQNFTGIQANMTLPQYQGALVGSNATGLMGSLQAAIRSKVSSAIVSQAELYEKTSAAPASNNIQYVNITLKYNVGGVETSENGISSVDLSWKSWAMSSPVPLGAFEANRIGGYLVKGATEIASTPQTQIINNGNIVIRLTYEVNSKLLVAADFPGHVQALSILNFTQMSKPVSTWNESFDLASNTDVWSTNLGGVHLADIFQTTVEAGNSTRLDYSLSYSLQAKVSAPGGSSAKGDIIISTFQGIPELLMAAIIVSSVLIGVGAIFYEKQITGKNRSKRGKR
jgi:hypothetical protein